MSPLLLFAQRYWRVLAIAAAVGLLLCWFTGKLEDAEQAGYERATDEMEARIAKANAETAALEQRQRAQSEKAAQAWEQQRNDLQSQVDGLLSRRVSIRVCKPARAAPVPRTASSAGSFDDPTSATVDAVPAGPDIRGVMVQFGGECERYRQQLVALQAWVQQAR